MNKIIEESYEIIESGKNELPYLKSFIIESRKRIKNSYLTYFYRSIYTVSKEELRSIAEFIIRADKMELLCDNLPEYHFIKMKQLYGLKNEEIYYTLSKVKKNVLPHQSFTANGPKIHPVALEAIRDDQVDEFIDKFKKTNYETIKEITKLYEVMFKLNSSLWGKYKDLEKFKSKYTNLYDPEFNNDLNMMILLELGYNNLYLNTDKMIEVLDKMDKESLGKGDRSKTMEFVSYAQMTILSNLLLIKSGSL